MESKFTWEAKHVIAVGFNDQAEEPQWDTGKVQQTKDLDAEKTTNCIWLDDNVVAKSGGFYAYTESSVYMLTVGSTTKKIYSTGGDEMYGSFEVARGDSVSLKINNAAATITANDNKANNLTSEQKIKVGGTFDIYVKTSNDHTVWASGYNDCDDGDYESALQNFCNSILTNTIDNGACNITHWDWVQGAWNYVLEQDDASHTLVNRFNAGQINYGADYAHTSVINEARTRYAFLNAKFGVTLTGATLPTSSNSLRTMQSGSINYTPVIVIISSIVIVSLLGAGLIIKRRKEDR